MSSNRRNKTIHPQPKQQQQQQRKDIGSSSEDGIWIGIDLGTSNSTCAVWDSTRGSPKWIRLPKTVAFSQQNGKMGRIMPSVVRWESPRQGDENDQPLVGCSALLPNKTDRNSDPLHEPSSSSLLQSVKRLLGKSFQDLDPQWVQTLDFEVLPPDTTVADTTTESRTHQSVRLVARTSKSNSKIITTPEEVLAIELKVLRKSSQAYLDRYLAKKQLQVPGSTTANANVSHTSVVPEIRNVIVGVPAHFSKGHVKLVEHACRTAGFEGYVGTFLEPTAAAMAYGLTMQETLQSATIMVIDMGGGTTDITIATKHQGNQAEGRQSDRDNHSKYSSYQVLVTLGDEALGGDDIDQAIVDYCISHLPLDTTSAICVPLLRTMCRQTKEALCREESPSDSETISIQNPKASIVITQQIFIDIIEPWLNRAKDLILKAKLELESSNSRSHVNEVVLVGGTTRILAIRKMIQNIFPSVELSTSLNPMSSVAQGLAIQAAIVSKQVPMHELKSALMLDCTPHSIGVELPERGGFVEIIPHNTPLPAQGSATFVLADLSQAGVTIHAVEEVGEGVYEPMNREGFTFLLRRLPPLEMEQMEERSIQVGMKVDVDGKFIVSIFDENDPEQVRKKSRFEKMRDNPEVAGELGYIRDLIAAEAGTTSEQLLLSLTLLGVFIVYVAVKMAFSDPSEIDHKILG